MVITSKKRGLLMEARRFLRAASDRVKQVHEAEESYDLGLDEEVALLARAQVWLDELIEAEESTLSEETTSFV